MRLRAGLFSNPAGLAMEPVWLGLAAPSIVSTAGNIGRTALRPFSAALELASALGSVPVAEESADGALARSKNPHTLLLSDLLTGQPLDGDGRIEIADIRVHADRLQDNLQRRIAELLQDACISLEEPVHLRISPTDGQLEVVGDSPQRAIVEAVLAANPSIATDFSQLAAMRSLLAAADKHRDFADAYARDPYQAVNDFAELFEGLDASQPLATLTGTDLRFDFDELLSV